MIQNTGIIEGIKKFYIKNQRFEWVKGNQTQKIMLIYINSKIHSSSEMMNCDTANLTLWTHELKD